MAVTLKDIWKLMDAADHHARAITRTHTEIRSLLATINIPEHADHKCRKCSAGLPTERALAFHDQNVHDGPTVPLSDEELAA